MAIFYIIAFSNLGDLIDMMCFIYWAFYALAFASLLIIRYKNRKSLNLVESNFQVGRKKN